MANEANLLYHLIIIGYLGWLNTLDKTITEDLHMKLFITLGALLLVLSACATFVDGTTQAVTFQSSPSDAEVLINGAVVGTTPFTIVLDREDGTQLTVRKDGYETVSMELNTALNSSFWGNILIGGVIGSTTDSATGASREYVPGIHMINLREL